MLIFCTLMLIFCTLTQPPLAFVFQKLKPHLHKLHLQLHQIMSAVQIVRYQLSLLIPTQAYPGSQIQNPNENSEQILTTANETDVWRNFYVGRSQLYLYTQIDMQLNFVCGMLAFSKCMNYVPLSVSLALP